jgi:hypothetical protein
VLRVSPLQLLLLTWEVFNLIILALLTCFCHSQWPRDLRRGFVVARLLRLWVRFPRGTWMSVCCECCVLSGRDLCDGLITRPEESYRLWCFVVFYLETSWMRRPCLIWGQKKKKYTHKQIYLCLVDIQLLLRYSQSAVDIWGLNSVFCFLKTILPLTQVQSHLHSLFTFSLSFSYMNIFLNYGHLAMIRSCQLSRILPRLFCENL